MTEAHRSVHRSQYVLGVPLEVAGLQDRLTLNVGHWIVDCKGWCRTARAAGIVAPDQLACDLHRHPADERVADLKKCAFQGMLEVAEWEDSSYWDAMFLNVDFHPIYSRHSWD